MSRPKIAIFLPDLRGGGAERSLVNLSGGLAAQGYCVDMVLVRAEGPYLSLLPPGVRVVDLKARRTFLALPALMRYLRQEKPDTLLAALEHPTLVALLAKRLTNSSVRLVVSVRNMLSYNAGVRANLTSPLELLAMKLLYPWADKISAVSAGVADNVAQLVGLLRESIDVIPNPVVSDELLAQAQEPVEDPWFLASAPPIILAAGRLTPQKDHPLLLRAFAEVRAKLPCRLLILGEGEERAALEALAQELGISEYVSLPGFAANPFACMNKARLFVLSSRWEGLPGVLIQALACGCPVISTDCPSGPAEILQNGKYGELVPVGDVGALALAMQKALTGERISPLPESWEPFGISIATSKYRNLLFPDSSN